MIPSAIVGVLTQGFGDSPLAVELFGDISYLTN